MHAETLRWLALALEDLKAHSPEDVPACEHAMACVRERGALDADLRAAGEQLWLESGLAWQHLRWLAEHGDDDERGAAAWLVSKLEAAREAWVNVVRP